MTIDQFIKQHEAKIGIMRYLILPILMAACFWILDSRYLSKSDWQSATSAQSAMIVQLGNEQKISFNKLTDAITALTNEQRNVAEFNRVNATAIGNSASQFEKHQVGDAARWEKTTSTLEKIDFRLDALEKSVAQHEVLLKIDGDAIDRLRK